MCGSDVGLKRGVSLNLPLAWVDSGLPPLKLNAMRLQQKAGCAQNVALGGFVCTCTAFAVHGDNTEGIFQMLPGIFLQPLPSNSRHAVYTRMAAVNNGRNKTA